VADRSNATFGAAAPLLCSRSVFDRSFAPPLEQLLLVAAGTFFDRTGGDLREVSLRVAAVESAALVLLLGAPMLVGVYLCIGLRRSRAAGRYLPPRASRALDAKGARDGTGKDAGAAKDEGERKGEGKGKSSRAREHSAGEALSAGEERSCWARWEATPVHSGGVPVGLAPLRWTSVPLHGGSVGVTRLGGGGGGGGGGGVRGDVDDGATGSEVYGRLHETDGEADEARRARFEALYARLLQRLRSPSGSREVLEAVARDGPQAAWQAVDERLHKLEAWLKSRYGGDQAVSERLSGPDGLDESAVSALESGEASELERAAAAPLPQSHRRSEGSATSGVQGSTTSGTQGSAVSVVEGNTASGAAAGGVRGGVLFTLDEFRTALTLVLTAPDRLDETTSHAGGLAPQRDDPTRSGCWPRSATGDRTRDLSICPAALLTPRVRPSVPAATPTARSRRATRSSRICHVCSAC
jgi:hypothetical protein